METLYLLTKGWLYLILTDYSDLYVSYIFISDKTMYYSGKYTKDK